ncbi:MAG: hypothetical protein KME08_07150 [Aphanothece sp. CMT-3BRIN-NPC111]|nr:hypothetical protein [Aphanothece sp. CMT-3BRIN-NPC111]
MVDSLAASHLSVGEHPNDCVGLIEGKTVESQLLKDFNSVRSGNVKIPKV